MDLVESESESVASETDSQSRSSSPPGEKADVRPPKDVRRRWKEVAAMVDTKSPNELNWEKILDAVSDARAYDKTSKDEGARRFNDQYLRKIICILLEQLPEEEQPEKAFQCIRQAVLSILGDLKAKENIIMGECALLDALLPIFDGENEENSMYLDFITFFKKHNGFALLATYVSERACTNQFPPLEVVHFLLSIAFKEVISAKCRSSKLGVQMFSEGEMENDTTKILKAVTKHVSDKGYSCVGCNYRKTWSVEEFYQDIKKMREYFFGSPLPKLPESMPDSDPSQQKNGTEDIASSSSIDAAKCRLASAQRWNEATKKSLYIAESEHALSTKEMEDARSNLLAIEKHSASVNGIASKEVPVQKKRRYMQD